MRDATRTRASIPFATRAATLRLERMRFEREERRALRELDDALTEALKESFPASDPISSLRPA